MARKIGLVLMTSIVSACNQPDAPTTSTESPPPFADYERITARGFMTIADTIDLDSEQALRQLCHRKYLLTNQDSLTSTQLGKDALILFLLKLNRSYLKVGYQYPDLLPISGCSTFMRDIISLHLQISPSKKKALSEFEMLRISANDCILWQRPNKLQGKIAALYQECRNMETSDMRSKY